MSFCKELAEAIKGKHSGAIKTLIKEGVDPNIINHRGCVSIAFDGMMRGGLTQENYERHLRAYAEGRVFTLKYVIEMALAICQGMRETLGDRCPLDAGARFYSSSPGSIGRADLTPKPMSRGKALKVAGDLRNGRTLGVLIAKKVREVDHSFCLVGQDGGIFRVDGAIPSVVNYLSNREAANLMRRGQRHGGLIIDIR